MLHDAPECPKAIDGCNNYWYKFSELLKIPLASSANMKRTTFTKKKCTSFLNKNVQKEKKIIGRLDTYTKIKCNFGIEKYDVTRLRILTHGLNIEFGRYIKNTGLIVYALNVGLVF